MMPAQVLSGAGTGASAKASASTRDADPAPEGVTGKPGFAEMLAPAGQATAKPAKPAEPPVAAGGEDEAPATEPRDDSGLPEQLLALIGASPAPPVAPPTAGSLPPQQITLPPAVARALAGGLPSLDAPSLPLPVTGAPATTTTTDAAGAIVLPPAVATTADPATVPLSDFAKALAQASGTDPGSDTGLATGTDLAGAIDMPDQAPLTASPNGTAAAIRAATVAPAMPAIAVPADPDAGFDDAFGARIGWLADQRIARAEIRLSPEHLGAIDVRLQIDGTRVSAEFQSAHADVRHALENSVGRLRDMLGQQGLQLAHSDVGQGRGGEAGNRSGQARSDGFADTDPGLFERPALPALRARGLLDEYA